MQRIGRSQIDDVTDEELATFMITELILFDIDGANWEHDAGRTFRAQVTSRSQRRWNKQKELFVEIHTIDAEIPGFDIASAESSFLPVSANRRRKALVLRDALKSANPTMTCLWDLRNLYSKDVERYHVIKAPKSSKGFYVKNKTSPVYLAISIMTALAAYGNTTGETPIIMAPEPKSYKDIFKRSDSEQWVNACKVEMSTLLDMDTFELVDYDRATMGPLLRSKWVFKLKTDEYGDIIKRKARLVVRGDMQSEDTYDDTFSPTSRSAAMRAVISIATELDMELKHFDVTAAFISAYCDRDNIYLAPPEGFEHLVPRGKCLRLRRSLYGLKQASHLYHKKLQRWLLKYGFEQADDEGTLYRYINKTTKETMILSMYVDDGLVAASSSKVYDDFLTEFKKEFTISDQGDLHYYLGVKITRDRKLGQTTLSQEQYIEDLLKRFNMMQGGRDPPTPFEENYHMTSDDACDKTDPANLPQIRDYQTIVGALLYLSSNTRPDIAIAVNQAARFMSCPGPSHIYAVKRILRYLRGTKTLKLVYQRGTDKPNTLEGFVDADHAGNPEDRISVSGYIIFFNGGPISWSSKRQPIVALSSSEAEFYAVSLAACEIEYLRKMLDGLGFPQKGPTMLYEDNQGTIYMSRSVGAFNRSKHISTRVFRLRELVNSGVLFLQKVATLHNIADVFTKSLGGPLLGGHRSFFLW